MLQLAREARIATEAHDFIVVLLYGGTLLRWDDNITEAYTLNAPSAAPSLGPRGPQTNSAYPE
jgi:hypothetical protein